MAEEFSESEVVFSDYHHHLLREDCTEEKRKESGEISKEKKRPVASSMPVNIPQVMLRRWDTEEAEEMEPPHVIVGRRVAGKMEFSVCTGNGRTLKGRDLRRFRNSILRLTGFIEA